MKKTYSLLMGILGFSLLSLSLAQAAVQFGPSTATEIKGVKLSESVKIGEGEKALTLKKVTQGLRQKKVVLVWASVYVAQVFSNATLDFSSKEKLKESLVKAPFAVSMTFVRNVGIEKIMDGFQDVLKENHIDTATAPFAEFLESVKKSGDVKDQQNYFFNFASDAGKEVIEFETNGKVAFSAKDLAPGTSAKFLNLWLGIPVDSGLEQLQEQLLKP